jgi:hypothetical protein
VDLKVARADADALGIAPILEPDLVLRGGDGGQCREGTERRDQRSKPFHHLLGQWSAPRAARAKKGVFAL